MLGWIFRRSKDIELQELSGRASSGDRIAHEIISSRIRSGQYRASEVAGSISVAGDVSGSVLITGSHNTVVRLSSGDYAFFEDLIEDAAFAGARQEFVHRTAENLLTHGSVEFFGEHQSSSLDGVLKMTAARAKKGNRVAQSLIYNVAKDRNILPVIEFATFLLSEASLNQTEAEDLSSLCWALGLNNEFTTAVEKGLQLFPDSEQLKFDQTSLFDRAGDIDGGLRHLEELYVPVLEITDQSQAENQIRIRRFMAHFTLALDQRERWFDEAIDIVDRFGLEGEVFIEQKITILKEAKRDLGVLSVMESFSKRDTFFQKGCTALAQDNYSDAKLLFAQCLKMDRESNSFENNIRDLEKLAEACEELKDYSSAQRYLLEFLDLQEAMGCIPGQRAAFIRMADLSLAITASKLRNTNRLDSTEYQRFMTEAILISQKIGDKKAVDLLTRLRDEKVRELEILTKFAQIGFPQNG